MRGLGGKERNGKDGVMIWGGIVRHEEEWERWEMEGWKEWGRLGEGGVGWESKGSDGRDEEEWRGMGRNEEG